MISGSCVPGECLDELALLEIEKRCNSGVKSMKPMLTILFVAIGGIVAMARQTRRRPSSRWNGTFNVSGRMPVIARRMVAGMTGMTGGTGVGELRREMPCREWPP